MKPVIYQILVRLFGNRNTKNKFYGSIRENGCGKFNDISDLALDEIKRLGVTHLWYTGVIAHASMTEYSAFGISIDDPDVVKGKAGSPYAIKDYYDADPDLASSPDKRMQELEALIERTHNHGLKVIIDFVPNHVARAYKSTAKPAGVADLGSNDNTGVFFDPNNNYYYIQSEHFHVPTDYEAGGNAYVHPLKDKQFREYPAKATGNDVFSAYPNITDWFETVKLNYGVNCLTGAKHFEPTPDTWLKMTDILLFWANKGIDGFRCDMCEMVPTEFWTYAIGKVKAAYPALVFIGEAYTPARYRSYIDAGFDWLYDKSGLYDLLRAAITGNAGLDRIPKYLRSEINGIENRMLSFLENHDEQRFASPQFADAPEKAIPLMCLAATLHPDAPVMLYFGQELGARGVGATGFSGDDGRTSIFDYTCVPEIQQWMNNGKFDGALLDEQQSALRSFYARLLNLCNSEEAIASGKFADLSEANLNADGFNRSLNYVFARYTRQSRVIIVVNIAHDNTARLNITIPHSLFNDMSLDTDAVYCATDLLNADSSTTIKGQNLLDSGLPVECKPVNCRIMKLS